MYGWGYPSFGYGCGCGNNSSWILIVVLIIFFILFCNGGNRLGNNCGCSL